MTNIQFRTIGSALFLSLGLVACSRSTSQPRVPSQLGVVRSTSALEAVVSQPGPVEVETVVGADWAVDRSGLLNLSHPKAVAAGLKEGDEPIVIAFHALTHPTRGLYLVDTGVEGALREHVAGATFGGLVSSYMHFEKLKVRTETRAWITARAKPIAGVFLTHLHLDHVSGMRGVPDTAPIYVGPGEGAERAFLNTFVEPTVDAELEGKGPLHEWGFRADPDGAFEGVIDVFGDGTVWAISVPGHTAGSTAYLARTPKGPVLFVGDACHTRWGWKNNVEPGSFSSDQHLSAVSLDRLERFVAKHPDIQVRLGHQLMDETAAR